MHVPRRRKFLAAGLDGRFLLGDEMLSFSLHLNRSSRFKTESPLFALARTLASRSHTVK